MAIPLACHCSPPVALECDLLRPSHLWNVEAASDSDVAAAAAMQSVQSRRRRCVRATCGRPRAGGRAARRGQQRGEDRSRSKDHCSGGSQEGGQALHDARGAQVCGRRQGGRPTRRGDHRRLERPRPLRHHRASRRRAKEELLCGRGGTAARSRRPFGRAPARSPAPLGARLVALGGKLSR